MTKPKRETKTTLIELDLELFQQMEDFLEANRVRFRTKRELFSHMVLNIDRLIDGNFHSMDQREFMRLQLENEKLKLQLEAAQEKLRDAAKLAHMEAAFDDMGKDYQEMKNQFDLMIRAFT